MAHGIRIYDNLAAALRDGYQVYDRTPTGYIVRQRINGLWGLALVKVIKPRSREGVGC